MDYMVSIRYTKQLMESLARRALVRAYLILLIPIATFAMLILSYARHGTTADYLAGFGLVGAILLGLSLNYFKNMRDARASAEKWGDRDILFHFTDECLHVTTPDSDARYPWHVFERLVRYKDLWLLFYSRLHYLVLPADEMAAGPSEFLIAKVRENGGKVK